MTEQPQKLQVAIATETTGFGQKGILGFHRRIFFIGQIGNAFNGRIGCVDAAIKLLPYADYRIIVTRLGIAHVDHLVIIVPQSGHAVQRTIQITAQTGTGFIHAVNAVHNVLRAGIGSHRVLHRQGVSGFFRQKVRTRRAKATRKEQAHDICFHLHLLLIDCKS